MRETAISSLPAGMEPEVFLQSSPRWYPFDQAQWATGVYASPSLPTKVISLNSLCVPLFVIIKAPGNTALPNSGKPQRQQLIFFKDV